LAGPSLPTAAQANSPQPTSGRAVTSGSLGNCSTIAPALSHYCASKHLSCIALPLPIPGLAATSPTSAHADYFPLKNSPLKLSQYALTNVPGPAALSIEDCGDPLLGLQLTTEGLPAEVHIAGLERGTEGMHQMVGQQADEQDDRA